MEMNEGIDINECSTNSRAIAIRLEKKDSVCPFEIADLETAITKTGFGLFNWLMIILIMPVACTGIGANSTMSFVVSAAHELKLTSNDKALLLSAPFAGMATSGYLWGIMSDSVGRKKLMTIGFLLDFVVNFGCGTIMSVPVMSVSKFLSGLIVCGPYSIFMVYLSEVFSGHHRDMVAQILGIFTSVGSMAQAGLAMWIIPCEMPDWMPLKSWQLFILIYGIPSLTVGLASCFFYESPKFLIDKERYGEALNVCKNIYSINKSTSSTSYPVKKLVCVANSNNSEKSLWECLIEAGDLFKPPFLNKIIFGIIYFFILFTNQNILRMWAPEIFTLFQNSNRTWDFNFCPLLIIGHQQEMTTPENSVYSKMMIIHAASACSHFLYLHIARQIGKKKTLIGDAILGGLCIASVPLLPAGCMFTIVAIYFSLCEVACYSFLGAVVQLFPTHLRAKSISITMVMGRLGVVLGNFILSKLIYTHCESMFYSLGAGALCMVAMLCLLNLTPYDDSKLSHENQN